MQNRDRERIYISKCITDKRKVTIIMKNGYQMRGIIIAQDDLSIEVDERGNGSASSRNLVYKGAISTIMPTMNNF